MKNINNITKIIVILMAIVSFSNFFGFRAAGISVLIGVIYFFINKAVAKRSYNQSGMNIKAIGKNLKQKGIWFLIFLPFIMDVISITISKLFLPGYIDHVISRAQNFVTFDKAALLIIELAILALGEEIAWRAFFQKQLTKVLPVTPVLIISSFLFAIGHFENGSFIIVAYDVFFVFINSIIYGIIFHKTNNVYISWISQFIANLLSIIIFLFL